MRLAVDGYATTICKKTEGFLTFLFRFFSLSFSASTAAYLVPWPVIAHGKARSKPGWRTFGVEIRRGVGGVYVVAPDKAASISLRRSSTMRSNTSFGMGCASVKRIPPLVESKPSRSGIA